MNHMKQLEELIAASVSPYHCIQAAVKQLTAGEFKELPLAESWELKQGGSYYINAFDSTLIAFTVGNELTAVPQLKLAASHTDWPCLKVKPSPEVTALEYGKLNVEVYGGPL